MNSFKLSIDCCFALALVTLLGALSPIEASAQDDPSVVILQNALKSEVVDPSWAAEATEQLQSAFGQNEDAVVQSEIDCRTTICYVSADVKSDDLTKLTFDIARQPLFSHAAFHLQFSEDRTRVELYIGREGFELFD